MGRGFLQGCGLALCLSALAGNATWAALGQEFHVRSWHIEDGLPEGHITAVQQTSDDYLWVATPKRLARFDGVRFKVFEESDTPALKDVGIASLLVDRRAALWIGCESGNLIRYEHTGFRTVEAPLTWRSVVHQCHGGFAVDQHSLERAPVLPHFGAMMRP